MSIFSTFCLYISKKYFFWSLIILVAIATIIGLFEFIELLRKTMAKPHIYVSDLIQLTFLKIPLHIQFFFPFICMVAANITLWRLNQSQEIVAARAVGLSTFQIIKGLLVVVTIQSFVNISLINPLSAFMQKRAENIENVLFKNRNLSSQLVLNESGLWLREKVNKNDRSIYIKRYSTRMNHFSDIHVFETDPDGVLVKHYVAEYATLEKNRWVLEKAHLWDENYEAKNCDTFYLETELSMAAIDENNAKPETISFWNLPIFIKSLYQSGLSAVKYELYWYAQMGKITQALALIFLAAAFCMHPTRYKKSSVLILLSVLSGFTLHFLSDVIYAFGLTQKIPLMLAAFTPSLITFCFSIGMLMHVDQG